LEIEPDSDEFLEDVEEIGCASAVLRNGSIWFEARGCVDGAEDTALALACLAIVLAAAVARACFSISATSIEKFIDRSAIFESEGGVGLGGRGLPVES
jgi:hypothetical protein